MSPSVLASPVCRPSLGAEAAGLRPSTTAPAAARGARTYGAAALLAWTLVLLGGFAGTVTSAPVGSGFTYQGELKVAGVPANAAYDFEFALFNVAVSGSAIATVLRDDAAVSAGRFTVELDFTDVPFAAAQEYFIEVRVRNGTDTGAYAPLLPRQKITPAPYALNARTVQAGAVNQSAIATGAVGSAQLQSSAVGTTQIGNLAVTDAKIADATITQAKLAFTPGDITAVVAGSGLVGGAATGSANLSVDTSAVQARIAGSCPNDMALQGVRADGSTSCSNIFKPIGIDGVSPDGIDAAVAVDGSPVIAYYDAGAGVLRLLMCRTPTCNGNADFVWPGSGQYGRYPSLAITANNTVWISYYHATSGDLLRASCTLPFCSPFAQVLDSANDVGSHSSLALRANGTAVIAYYDATAMDLKLHDGTTARLLDATGQVGTYAALAIRPDGRPIVAYYDATAANQNLKLFDCVDVSCTGGTARLLDSTGDVGESAAIALRSDGRALVSYFDDTGNTVKLYDCADTNCSSGTARTLGAALNGSFTAIAVRANDTALIAFHDAASLAVRIYNCDNAACSSGSTQAPAGAAPANPGVAPLMLRSDGRPLMAYRPNYFGDLSLLICGNTDCSALP